MRARIPKHPRYWLNSKTGRVFSEKCQRHIRSRSYYWVTVDGKQLRLDRLMLETFIGPAPTQISEPMHMTDSKGDCRLVNLVWRNPGDKPGVCLKCSRQLPVSKQAWIREGHKPYRCRECIEEAGL